MKAIQLTRTFLKKPIYGIGLLLGIVLLIEGLSWTSAYTVKVEKLVKAGGLLPYVSLWLRSLLIPEICSTYIIITLINLHHTRYKIDSVDLTWRDITKYELLLLPTILLSFFVFNPATETIRFLLEQFPNYTFSKYWEVYLGGTFTAGIYFRYLIPMLLIGYIVTNTSLLSDYFTQRQEAQEAAESQAAMAVQAAQAAIAAQTTVAAAPASNYLSHMKGKNQHGELDFPVEDVYFFTIEDRYYYAQLEKGQYLVAKTLNELETELDPSRFFRIKRDYIVNRQAVLNYAYWENGKYIVRLNTPDRHEIVVPRARMQEFREWLQGNGQRPYADTSTDSFIMAS
ncbi:MULTISPECIES: LytTR family DNA-binding domain-containing protein [Spirosoma]|uniref:LytTR family transcriptional regulator n=1 Tax=Spirosoma liriopis TaxID=2937440 RepID=A0ABT0HJW6_9BACT|nr:MULTISPECIES: LytTR family DNA-binding domain-containing protein [Spirosoma]MCK8492464.1 LytTR family transcriptional regulator [Spirosoma liriopis]UHG91936.1 LytTR family transcriptional regulator [Spirosoma oryzicola]